MAPKLVRIDGEGRFSNADSRDILRQLGKLLGPKEADRCFYEAMNLISKRIPNLTPVSTITLALLRNKGSLHAHDVLSIALFNLGDRKLAIEFLVEQVTAAVGKKRPLELADIVLSAYLGDGPDGTTVGAIRLSKRAGQGGRT